MIAAQFLMMLAMPAMPVAPAAATIQAASGSTAIKLNAVDTDATPDIEDQVQPTIFTWEGREHAITRKPGPGSIS